MKKFHGTFDHRLESLEGRSLLSADPGLAAPAGAAEHVVIADAEFLNAASDTSATDTNGADDSAMYDFGGAWGTQALGEHVESGQVDLGGGAVDQDPGGPMRHTTPGDLLGSAPMTWQPAAEYDGSEPVITANFDPIAADSPTDDAPVSAPVVTPTATPAPVIAAPEAMQAVSGGSTMVWLELPGAAKKADAAAAAESVVIVSTFLGQ